MPSKADLAIYQGDDYAAVVTVVNESGAPPDLSEFEAHAHIRVGPATGHPQLVVDITTEVTSNLVILSIPAVQTVGLSGTYVWDLQLFTPDGARITIMAGNVKVTPDVTRVTLPVKRKR